MASNVHPKMTNQLFVASHNNNHDPMDSLNAATFVAVVSSNLGHLFLDVVRNCVSLLASKFLHGIIFYCYVIRFVHTFKSDRFADGTDLLNWKIVLIGSVIFCGFPQWNKSAPKAYFINASWFLKRSCSELFKSLLKFWKPYLSKFHS